VVQDGHSIVVLGGGAGPARFHMIIVNSALVKWISLYSSIMHFSFVLEEVSVRTWIKFVYCIVYQNLTSCWTHRASYITTR
jgi:hypothetical protein